MSSRKEQKETLRREREAREQAARAAARRRQLMGYGVGAALALAGLVIVVVLLVSGGGGSDGEGAGDLYPSGASIPDPGPASADIAAAAKAAGCELESSRPKSRDHTGSLDEKVDYDTNPPTSGSHYAVPAEDNIYNEQPQSEELVHTLEHGRVIVWFKRTLPGDVRGKLRTWYEEDPFHVVLTPNETNMTYAVAATAWNDDPQPFGTGRLVGCPEFNDDVIDVLRAFKDEHRDRGPEVVN